MDTQLCWLLISKKHTVKNARKHALTKEPIAALLAKPRKEKVYGLSDVHAKKNGVQ